MSRFAILAIIVRAGFHDGEVVVWGIMSSSDDTRTKRCESMITFPVSDDYDARA